MAYRSSQKQVDFCTTFRMICWCPRTMKLLKASLLKASDRWQTCEEPLWLHVYVQVVFFNT